MFMGKLTHLKEGKVLILIDLYCKNGIAGGLSKTTQTHLGIKEVHHWLLNIREGEKIIDCVNLHNNDQTQV